MLNKISTKLEIGKIRKIVEAIAQDKLKESLLMLDVLVLESKELPQQWLLNTKNALKTRNWNLLSDGFARQEFVGANGYFLIIAPYTVRRESSQITKLTAIFGCVIFLPCPLIEKLEHLISENVGKLHQKIPLILSYEKIAACGNVGSEYGEAFIVANNWNFLDSLKGPSLIDTTEQQRRFLDSGKECIRRIWEPDSAELLLSALEEDKTASSYNRHLEYQLHDAGHATGLGIDRKIHENLFSTYWNASVEEWRADGVEFYLAVNTLSTEEAAKVIAVNLCVRFALDAHRSGGLDRDGDVCASLLVFDRLLESGKIKIDNGRLSLCNLSYKSLLEAVEPHQLEAVNLTRQELNLDYPTGLSRLYGSVGYSKIAEKLFQWLIIERCQNLYSNLR